jgi:hypothetical protein
MVSKNLTGIELHEFEEIWRNYSPGSQHGDLGEWIFNKIAFCLNKV